LKSSPDYLSEIIDVLSSTLSNFLIYLIPGRGEDLNKGLGRLLTSFGCNIKGRGLVGEFVRIRFAEQLDRIAEDLNSGFRTPESILVGSSYGGYLLLHALADLPPFPGRVLLFSPVLGEAVTPNRRYGSRPPRPRKLLQIAESGTFPSCGCLEVHTGEEDSACDPDLARKIIPRLPNASLRVVPGAGHELDLEYVGRMFINFVGDKRKQ